MGLPWRSRSGMTVCFMGLKWLSSLLEENLNIRLVALEVLINLGNTLEAQLRTRHP